jgi:hypothetical protein
LRLTTLLAFNKCCPDDFDISLAGLVTANQVTDVFTVIREFPRVYLAFYPLILIVGDGNRFAFGTRPSASILEIILLVYFSIISIR